MNQFRSLWCVAILPTHHTYRTKRTKSEMRFPSIKHVLSQRRPARLNRHYYEYLSSFSYHPLLLLSCRSRYFEIDDMRCNMVLYVMLVARKGGARNTRESRYCLSLSLTNLFELHSLMPTTVPPLPDKQALDRCDQRGEYGKWMRNEINAMILVLRREKRMIQIGEILKVVRTISYRDIISQWNS